MNRGLIRRFVAAKPPRPSIALLNPKRDWFLRSIFQGKQFPPLPSSKTMRHRCLGWKSPMITREETAVSAKKHDSRVRVAPSLLFASGPDLMPNLNKTQLCFMASEASREHIEDVILELSPCKIGANFPQLLYCNPTFQ